MEDMELIFKFDKKKMRDQPRPTFVAKTAEHPPYPPSLQKKIDYKIETIKIRILS